MRLSFLIFSLSCHHVLQLALGDEITLTRHADGDVFTIPGSCKEACMVLSSYTASPYGSASILFDSNLVDSCSCQCNDGLPIFREDLGICVDNIQECDVAGFLSSSGLVEKVPYVFLPQYGQIVYPQAEIKFEGVESPLCVITGVQQLGRSGWSDLRNISDVEFPLSLYRDEERTFLQWTGEAKLREAAEGKIVVVKLACRDSYPSAVYRGVFTPCVAFRVAGSPSKGAIKEVLFSTSPPKPQGLSSSEYTAIGISSVLLALIYIASVSLYLHSRKTRRKDNDEHTVEVGNCNVDVHDTSGLVKCNPLLSVSRHFESDTNSAVSETDLIDKLLLQSESESEIENVNQVTSAVIHPYEECSPEPVEQNNSSGPIIGERLPEENVRVIETTENGNHQNMPMFPGTQRRKLYFNPAYFEKQLLAKPPPAAVEFLLKIREVISIAKHKMAAKRFVPTLNEIPEESSSSERKSTAPVKSHRKRASSVQNGLPSFSKSNQRSLRCAGCSGCNHILSSSSSTPSLPTALDLAENSVSGESRVRAWLEDVKQLDARWRNLDEERNFTKRYFDHVNQIIKAKEAKDADVDSTRMSTRSLPSISNEISQIGVEGCSNGIFARDDVEARSAKSVTHETGYSERQAEEVAEWTRRNARDHEESVANSRIRRGIENSFKQQLEQLHTAKLTEKSSTKPIVDPARPTLEKSLSFDKIQTTNTSSKVEEMKKTKESDKEISETRALLGIINDELSTRSTSDAKRIMDAVIKELVVAKVKDKVSSSKASDYETDSLEKTKVNRKYSSSPVLTDKSSPAQSTALPMDEELTMRNAIIDVRIDEETSNLVKSHNLPEVVPLRTENYALVSEVYVNDGYASPSDSDDESLSPEIQYESENPGHLTIKVVDSPNNYVKQDESEYEPDTLDRKPMKLKINEDITYERDPVNEVYVDSLERSSQILLRSKRSFKQETDNEIGPKLPREYNSLREIYEARLMYQQQQEIKSKLGERNMQMKDEAARLDGQMEKENNCRNNDCDCSSPLLSRYERRQRKANNQPDVVPKPPPPPPIGMTMLNNQIAKNAQDGSFANAGDPTTCKDTPVVDRKTIPVVGKPPSASRKLTNTTGSLSVKSSTIPILANDNDQNHKVIEKEREANRFETPALTDADEQRRNERHQQYRRFSKWRGSPADEMSRSSRSPNRRTRTRKKSEQHRSRSRSKSRSIEAPNFEDSAYVSSPESNNSRRRLLLLAAGENETRSSGSESDESTSGNGANSESGAESIETDSVFFGNFRARAERERLALEAGCHRRDEIVEQQQQKPAFNANSRVY